MGEEDEPGRRAKSGERSEAEFAFRGAGDEFGVNNRPHFRDPGAKDGVSMRLFRVESELGSEEASNRDIRER